MKDVLTAGLRALSLPEDCEADLEQYGTMLLQKNEVMNLTAITDPEDVARLHFLDSLALLNLTDFAGKSVVDVGTGAGLPGLPLRICRRDIRLTLLDSLGKRIAFLQEVCDALGLADVACVHARAEEFAAAHREEFDIAVSRAVAALPMLCELCLPLVAPGGEFLAMKSVECDEELHTAEKAIATLGGRVEEVRDYSVPGADLSHRLIRIRKERSTPGKYPRAFAKIKKSPL